ncbi:MAG: 23S rRNA (guanosine(2251)-2'-O)-methyltransferase RlmB [bacterium]
MADTLIYGRNSVLEALLAGNRKITGLVVSETAGSRKIEEIKKLASRQGIAVQYRTRREMDELCGSGQHQGVAVFIEQMRESDLDDILDHAARKREAPFLLVLDRVEDPRNLGSLIRTGEAAGLHGVIISKHESCGLTPAVAKAASGALEYVPVVQVSNLAMTCEKLKKMGVWLFGAKAQEGRSWSQADFTLPLALLLGSEGKGLKNILEKKCDFFVSLPMRGHISSLNVSVAGAILMYEVVRQRNWQKLVG